MAEIVNLRRARKQKGREAARREGGVAAARSGEGRAVQALRAAEAALAERRHEGHRRLPEPAVRREDAGPDAEGQ